MIMEGGGGGDHVGRRLFNVFQTFSGSADGQSCALENAVNIVTAHVEVSHGV